MRERISRFPCYSLTFPCFGPTGPLLNLRAAIARNPASILGFSTIAVLVEGLNHFYPCILPCYWEERFASELRSAPSSLRFPANFSGPRSLQVEQQIAPVLRALAGAIGEADQFLAALRRRADQLQDELLFVFEACLEMDAIRG